MLALIPLFVLLSSWVSSLSHREPPRPPPVQHRQTIVFVRHHHAPPPVIYQRSVYFRPSPYVRMVYFR